MITRRTFIRTIGKGSAAVALVGVAACTTDEQTPTTRAVATTAPESTTTTMPATTSSSTSPTTEVSEPGLMSEEWRRVNLGFVSAYVFVRGGEAALVDTGTSGSTSDIEATLSGLGVGWSDLSTVLLTHHHGDHIGSLPEVMVAAPDAVAYAGAEDIPNITSPRPITAVADGDSVFGLRIVATPGHTPGHISILYPGLPALIAGDAIVGEDGGVAGPPAQFTADPATANESIVKLAGLEFDAIYFGHGEPVTSGGSDLVAQLAASL